MQGRPLIVLERFAWTPTATFGRLHLAGGVEVFTVERPWLDNEVNVSCIPEGRYEMRRGTFRGKYEDLELVEVPGRSAIEVHVANLASELRGCIAPGMRLGVVEGEWAVVASRQALSVVLESLHGAAREALCVTRYAPDGPGWRGPLGVPFGSIAGD